MQLEIKEVLLYGEYNFEYMKLAGIIYENDKYYEFNIFMKPEENLVMNIMIDSGNYDYSPFEWHEVIEPHLQIKILKYLTTTRNSKLLRILREAVIVMCDRDWRNVTVADSNKHINYYLDKLLDCFNGCEAHYFIKDGFTFYLDEHLKN